MKIAVVHNRVDADGAPDDLDVIVQAHSVAAAAASLGHRAEIFSRGLDLRTIQQALVGFGPDVVFNLVESIDGSCRLQPLFPSLLEHLGIAYTGASSSALWSTNQKVWAKQRMCAAGIPTPVWIGPVPGESSGVQGALPIKNTAAVTWIVKSLWEHASFGMNSDALVCGIDEAAVKMLLTRRAPALGGACFAEAFIDGREFNLSLLEVDGKPQVLPCAEIRFAGFGMQQPRIVDYRAKWETDSFEYRHTSRRFDFPEKDRSLLERLKVVALSCWGLFGLSGYARIDFRVDLQGRAWVLEVNANPCISPDAGFAASVERAGLSYEKAVSHILSSAAAPSRRFRVETSKERHILPLR